MSLLAKFDDICRGFNHWRNDADTEFETFARNQEECRQKWLSTEEKCSNVLKELSEARASREKLELQVRHVTELLKSEIQIRQRLQREEKDLGRKLNLVKQIVSTDRNIAEETRDRLVSISSVDSYCREDLVSPGDQLIDTTSDEIESSTRSILSSLDITTERTEEDLELSMVRSVRGIKTSQNALGSTCPTRSAQPHQRMEETFTAAPVTPIDALKSRFSSSNQSITPKTIQNIDGFIHKSTDGQSRDRASSEVEVRKSSSAFRAVRQHNYASKVILKQEICMQCKTRIRFGRSALKCVDCFMTCHVECKSTTPNPCIPTVRIPTHFAGTIADYSPKTSPMIPSLLIHCLQEIESRGITEGGIYRVSAPEREINILKENLLNGKIRAEEMTNAGIHTVAGVVRSFLFSLKEPLVTFTARESFIKLSYLIEETDIQTMVCSLIPELPQPNRDTLAYLMLHLQRLAESRSYMSTANLSKVFAPMVIGSSRSPVEDGLKKLQELKEQQMAMEKLLSVPGDYWSCFGKPVDSTVVTPVQVSKRFGRKTGFFTSPHF